MLAGVDLNGEEEALHAALSEQPWVARALVRNDTFAVLRSGTDASAGVAVVCGAGINCVGVAPDGRTARFPALGAITGDWGGGYDVGLGALGAAVRADDARDEPTTLSRIVPEHFGLSTAEDVAIALHTRQLSGWRLADLSPLVFAAAHDGDPAAGALIDRLADEVAGFALAALKRLDMLDDDVDVVLGGGLLRAGSAQLDDRIDATIHAAAPRARIVRTTQPPVVGAAVLALDEAGRERAGPDPAARAVRQRRGHPGAVHGVRVGRRADARPRRTARRLPEDDRDRRDHHRDGRHRDRERGGETPNHESCVTQTPICTVRPGMLALTRSGT